MIQFDAHVRHTVRVEIAMAQCYELAAARGSSYTRMESYHEAARCLGRVMLSGTAEERDVARKHRDRMLAKAQGISDRLQRANILYGDDE
jgi:hypothetical protein